MKFAAGSVRSPSRRTASGFTLIEVVVASAILMIAVLVIYLLLFATDKSYQTETGLRDAQWRLQVEMDNLSQEARESSQALIRTFAFTDTLMPTSAQSLIVFPSARDANGAFQVLNARPEWQKLVVYAPYYNPATKMGELRRYEVYSFDPAFTDSTQSPVIAVTAATISLGSSSVLRGSGKRVMTGFDHLKIAPNANWDEIELALQGGAPLLRKVNLLTGVKGRN